VARIGSGTIVAGLTTAAVATIGFLAHQASANIPAGWPPPRSGTSAPVGTADTSRQPGAVPGPGEAERQHTLPAASGSGVRVVYTLRGKRVWLVGENGRVIRTYPVFAGSVDPAPGQYTVTSRSDRIQGSDGVPVEHVVRFTGVGGVVIGFSAAVDGSTPDTGSRKKTGGIREQRADGRAMWTFATVGTKVVVVE
jgi:hypothetical protein